MGGEHRNRIRNVRSSFFIRFLCRRAPVNGESVSDQQWRIKCRLLGSYGNGGIFRMNVICLASPVSSWLGC